MALFSSPKCYVLFQWAKLLFHTSESMLEFLRSLCRHCSRGFHFHKMQAFSKVHAGVYLGDFKESDNCLGHGCSQPTNSTVFLRMQGLFIHPTGSLSNHVLGITQGPSQSSHK